MKKSAFRHYNLSQAKRHQMAVQAFGGADYTPQRFSISDAHAIGMKNYVYMDGAMQKRHGVEHLLSVADFTYVPSSPSNPSVKAVDEVHTNAGAKAINGMWSAKMEDGNVHVFAHIGKLLYEISGFGGNELKAEPFTEGVAMVEGNVYPLAIEFEDYKSSAFYSNGKLFFLGGNKYMVIRYKTIYANGANPVENGMFATVPTTTISITAKNAVVNQRTTLDRVNLLQQKRKNLCISGVDINYEAASKESGLGFVYQLDAPIVGKEYGDIASLMVVKIKRRAK